MVPVNGLSKAINSTLWYLAVEAKGRTTTLQYTALSKGQIERKLVLWFLSPQAGSYTHCFLFRSPLAGVGHIVPPHCKEYGKCKEANGQWGTLLGPPQNCNLVL